MLTFPSVLETFWRIPPTVQCWTRTSIPRFGNTWILLVWKSLNVLNQGYPVHELSFLFFYAIPIFFLTFFYTCMINTIRKANTGIRRSAYRFGMVDPAQRCDFHNNFQREDLQQTSRPQETDNTDVGSVEKK